ncbi:Csu type fimbrial protein [Aureimonas glaciei]|jgi:spore coat protein U-like protein|uniref:Spore coat protein U n=1 Tax=Aureimonas glaciei TaxID=1776957 RepID=A0A916Y284_9HYPH|nr:spore coat protein U domain-containing protein [Aureimonas glaciei]GGD27616.1 spore coat protein U [Aureimonas glaciei]
MLRFALLIVFTLLAASGAKAAACTVEIGDLAFGSVDSLFAAPTDSVASVRIDCVQVTPGAAQVVVCLHLGAGSGGAVGGVRQLTSGGRTLAFQLYQDGGYGSPWGSRDAPSLGAPRRVVAVVSGEVASATIDLFGRVPGGQSTAAAGRYDSSFVGADTVFEFAEGDLDCNASGGAGTGQAAFSVQADIPANCLVEAGDIDFGEHGVIDRAVDAEARIAVTCTPETGYSVTLGPGLGGGTDPEQRILRAGSDLAIYGLYLDPARSQPFGSSLETRLPGTGTGTQQTVPVYGRVPPQPVRPGTYSDTVAVTITYGDGSGL